MNGDHATIEFNVDWRSSGYEIVHWLAAKMAEPTERAPTIAELVRGWQEALLGRKSIFAVSTTT